MFNMLPQESLDLFNIPISGQQLAVFESYAALLIEWNARFNLTAVREPEEIRTRHFLDSISCLTVIPENAGSLIDIGTGAGFPGLVLKILRPEIRLTLVESVGKKAGFCRLVVEQLGLERVEVLEERAEVLGQLLDHREQYDWAVARAVAAMPTLAEYLLPLVCVGGNVLAQKGRGGLEEAQSAAAAIQTLGGELTHHSEIHLPGIPDPHTLLVFHKNKATPKNYPRRVGVPGKRPM